MRPQATRSNSSRSGSSRAVADIDYPSPGWFMSIVGLRALAALTLFLTTLRAWTWDYEGHRIINELALASLPTNFPGFTLTKSARERVAFLAGEADRWRNSSDPALKH